MPLIKEAPPKRRLGRTTGDTIVALFEGKPSSPGTEEDITNPKIRQQQQHNRTVSNDNNENIVAQLFPSKQQSDNHQTETPREGKQEEVDGGGDDNFQSNDLSKYTQQQQQDSSSSSSQPVPPPRPSNFSSAYDRNLINANNNALQQNARKVKLATKEVQTDTGGAEFRLYELVLSTPSATGIVTREHAAHRAMLDRQLSQRVVDARLDERFNRQSIEEARELAFESLRSAFEFHAQAMNDLMYMSVNGDEDEENENENENENDENNQKRTTAETRQDVDGQMIDEMNTRRQINNKRKKIIPRLVPIQKYHESQDENYNLRQRVDLLERKLQAQSQGIPYLMNTVRFPAPPPSIEVLEAEESLVRSRIEQLQDDLSSSLNSIWALPPLSMLNSHSLSHHHTPQSRHLNGNMMNNQQQHHRSSSRQGQQQRSLSIKQHIMYLINDEQKERNLIESEERDAFRGDIVENQVTSRFIEIIRVLNNEKEMYKLRADFVIVAASEESSRRAMEEEILDFRMNLLEIFFKETQIKTDLTRKLRNSMKDQHNQMMRHKKEMSVKVLPPVADRVAPKNSSVKITPEAKRAAAIALHHQNKMTATTWTSSSSLPAIDQKRSNPNEGEAQTPRPPQQAKMAQSTASSNTVSRISKSGFSGGSSSARAPLYNSGFSRPYTNL